MYEFPGMSIVPPPAVNSITPGELPFMHDISFVLTAVKVNSAGSTIVAVSEAVQFGVVT